MGLWVCGLGFGLSAWLGVGFGIWCSVAKVARRLFKRLYKSLQCRVSAFQGFGFFGR